MYFIHLSTISGTKSFSSSAIVAAVYSPSPMADSFAATASRQRTCPPISEVRKERRDSVGESRFSWKLKYIL